MQFAEAYGIQSLGHLASTQSTGVELSLDLQWMNNRQAFPLSEPSERRAVLFLRKDCGNHEALGIDAQ